MVSGSQSKVYFFFSNCSFTLRKRALLKEFIINLFKREKKELGRLNFIFCTDYDLLKLNKKYLFHNFYTDILTFDLSDKKNKIVADIYISIDRVKKNSLVYKTTFKKELYRVMFHGALHLCGYKDKSSKQLREMKQKEDFYLSLFYQ